MGTHKLVLMDQQIARLKAGHLLGCLRPMHGLQRMHHMSNMRSAQVGRVSTGWEISLIGGWMPDRGSLQGSGEKMLVVMHPGRQNQVFGTGEDKTWRAA